jgi:hypothetical protein
MQFFAAFTILFFILMFAGLFALAGRREVKRRAALNIEEQERLKRDDAIWSQQYGF